MAALQYKFPGLRREEQAAFLLDHGDALRADSRRERVGDETVEQDASGERFESAGDEFQQSRFAAGIGAEHGDDFAGTRLKAAGFQREERSLRGIRGIGVADLLDAQANFAGSARGVDGTLRGGRERSASCAAHASRLRNR